MLRRAVLFAVLAVLRSSIVVTAAPVLVLCETTKGPVRMHVSGPDTARQARQAGCSAARLRLIQSDTKTVTQSAVVQRTGWLIG